ncbi:hypothetical protein T11_9824 [Trichinella zimbabwensis]|uniref:Carbohydrate binding module family 35 domain-containing protein n=1 Tax=Trichinella zimbabwensis TaxID=268475 RepID=A0A0V1I756_9BILA|nr:hypothetical protein T11_9824 [Trichinella zimbabwensis]
MAEQARSGFWSMQAKYASNKNNKLVFVFHRAVGPIVTATSTGGNNWFVEKAFQRQTSAAGHTTIAAALTIGRLY